MNKNKLYFIQTLSETGKRHAYLVSSPSVAEAVTEVQDKWCDDDEEVIHFEKVKNLVDTDDYLDGKTYNKIHN